MKKLVTAAAILVWESVGRKLFLVPAAVAGVIGYFDVLDIVSISPNQPVSVGQTEIALKWAIAVVIILAWFVGGLFRQALALRMAADAVLSPDSSAKYAFQHLFAWSRWALGKNPREEANYYGDVESELRDQAKLGRLTVWGRPYSELSGVLTSTLTEIEPGEWANLRFEMYSCATDGEPSARVLNTASTLEIAYDDVRVSRYQVRSTWPRAGFWERWRDQAFPSRLEFLRRDQAG